MFISQINQSYMRKLKTFFKVVFFFLVSVTSTNVVAQIMANCPEFRVDSSSIALILKIGSGGSLKYFITQKNIKISLYESSIIFQDVDSSNYLIETDMDGLVKRIHYFGLGGATIDFLLDGACIVQSQVDYSCKCEVPNIYFIALQQSIVMLNFQLQEY